MLSIHSTLPLPSSPYTIPQLGFGVFRATSTVCTAACLVALAHGYRHIDTAQYYENEAEVGQAVRESGIPRSEVFVTTKMLQLRDTVDEVLDEMRASVRKIGLGYVDLFLVHTPNIGREGRERMWTALERLKEEGGTRSIGVSNFGVAHLEQLAKFSPTVPAVNQIELHPWCQQTAVTDYCRAHGIVIQAYAPLVRAEKNADPTLVSIAENHGVTPPQVLVRWSLQHGFNPLPKSGREARVRSNADVYGFELSEEEVATLDKLALPGGEGAICPYLADCP